MDWIEREYYIPETGQPMKLADYQKRVLREALRVDALGNYVYSTILWGDIKKSAKSSITAAVALWMADTKPWASIKVVANDLKQADSREAAYMRNCIKLNPRLKNTVKVTPSGYKIEFPNNSRIEAVPIDPKGEAGGNDDMIIFTELWAASNKAAQLMWSEMTTSPTKFGKSFRWVETYAGFDGESPILQPLYERIVQKEFRIDQDIELYADPATRTIAMWNTKPRLPWQTPEYYKMEEANLTPGEFNRIHLNKWGSSASSFLEDILWWDRLKAHLPPLTRRTPIVLAADGAYKSDNFGLVGVSRHPDRDEHLAIRLVRKWVPTDGQALDFDEIEEEIKTICQTYDVLYLAYDPYQLHQMMASLYKANVVATVEFTQSGGKRPAADKALYDLIQRGGIEHDGNLDLREHIQNANKVELPDRGLRLEKKANGKKIDLAVATSMACYTLIEETTL